MNRRSPYVRPESVPADGARPLRADAVRNRRKILDAAREQIAARGPDVAMDEIAAAAEVAVGTLYRHFPAKTELVAAVIGEYVSTTADGAEAALTRVRDEGASAVDELVTFLRGAFSSTVTASAVKSVASALGARTGHGEDEQRAGAAVAEMIRAGQRAGDVHPDVTVEDVYLLFATVPVDRPEPERERWITLVLAGLLARPRP